MKVDNAGAQHVVAADYSVRDESNSAGADPLALGVQKQASDDRSLCLENPRPVGAVSSLTENVTCPFQAEPAQPEVDLQTDLPLLRSITFR